MHRARSNRPDPWIRRLLLAAVLTTIDDGESPLGSTELDDEPGHNCKMSADRYQHFTQRVVGLDDDTWAKHRTESALCSMILQDLDAMLYYFDTDWQVSEKPVLHHGDLTDMAIIPPRWCRRLHPTHY